MSNMFLFMEGVQKIFNEVEKIDAGCGHGSKCHAEVVILISKAFLCNKKCTNMFTKCRKGVYSLIPILIVIFQGNFIAKQFCFW